MYRTYSLHEILNKILFVSLASFINRRGKIKLEVPLVDMIVSKRLTRMKQFLTALRGMFVKFFVLMYKINGVPLKRILKVRNKGLSLKFAK